MCPADYDDAMQTDSDCGNDPEYTPEVENAPATPASPQLSGGEPITSSSAYRRSQRQKNKQGRQDSFDAALNELNAKRNRITSPTHEEDDDEITGPREQSPRTPKRKAYNRRVKSVVWDHATLENDKNVCIVLKFG